MKHVLVTGATGFIAQTLIPSLMVRGVEVTALARKPEKWPQPKEFSPRWIAGDMRDLSAVKRAVGTVEGIYHLAAATACPSLKRARTVNVGGVENLIQAVRDRETPPRLVYVSSLAVAGKIANQGVTETEDCLPVSNYGKTKYEAEQILRSHARDVPATIVRPPCVFGPWDRNLFPLFQAVGKGWNLSAGSAKHRFSFLHVDDLTAGLQAAMRRGSTIENPDDRENSGVYYLADPDPVSFVQIAEWIRPLFGRKSVRTVVLPFSLCWGIAAVSEGWGRITGGVPFLDRDKIREAKVGSWVCLANRAEKELGFHPSEDLKTRLKNTFDWYLERGWIKSPPAKTFDSGSKGPTG